MIGWHGLTENCRGKEGRGDGEGKEMRGGGMARGDEGKEVRGGGMAKGGGVGKV